MANWGAVITESFQNLWFRFVDITPRIVGAILIFIVGLFIAEGLGRLVAKLLQRLYIDKAIERLKLKAALEKVGFKLEVSRAIGLLATWFLIIVFLIAAADILRLTQISQFLRAVVLYVPNVIIAVVILVVGVILGNFVYTVVKEAASAARLAVAGFLAAVAKWAILIFSLMAALVQLKVASELIQILFTGLVAMLALAGGLAFGLGGKDKAKQLLDKITKGGV